MRISFPCPIEPVVFMMHREFLGKGARENHVRESDLNILSVIFNNKF